jgi:uncharacterized protein
MVQLHTGDGLTLDAEVDVPTGAKAGVVLAHPHPQYGGDMRAPLITALFERLARSGVAVLRFDFRGVGRSEGRHDEGRGERLDVTAAVAQLADRLDGAPVVAAGWSFGADVSLAVDDAAIAGWFAIAPPLRLVPATELVAATDDRPKVLAVPQHDQLNPPDRARPIVDGWRATRLEVIPGADHFMAGRADRVAALCLELVEELLA